MLSAYQHSTVPVKAGVPINTLRSSVIVSWFVLSGFTPLTQKAPCG